MALKVVISAIFVFDSAAAPVLHIPLPLIIGLYLGSIAETYGIVKLVRVAVKRHAKRKAAGERG